MTHDAILFHTEWVDPETLEPFDAVTENTIRVAETQRDYADERRTEPCPICDGTGQVWDLHMEGDEYVDWLPCDRCWGTGTVPYGEVR